MTKDYSGYMLFFFENGKVAKVNMESYATKTNRRKLLGAYSDKSPAASIAYIQEDCEFLLTSAQGRMLLMHTGAVQPKTTRNTQGVAAMTLRKGGRLLRAVPYAEGNAEKAGPLPQEYPCTGRAAYPGGDRRGTVDAVSLPAHPLVETGCRRRWPGLETGR